MNQISRVTRSKAEAQNAYDTMSEWYDLLAGGSEQRFKEQGLQMLGVQTGETVLEIGFGTGRSLLALARSVGTSGKVYGIDISPGMYRFSQSLLRKAGLADRVELKIGDAAALPFPSESIDAIFISFTLELFDTPEIPIVVAECRRVLNRGGRICVVSMTQKEGANVMITLYEWMHRALPSWVDCRPIRAQLFLKEAGFDIVERREQSMWGLPVEILLAKRPA
jgi:demethylmenaquinone methyltransferase/2-methoxy-6-polyprenyl-1,4-benzoquinol methylase